jgi:uncharacterized protein (TIGR00369 family)
MPSRGASRTYGTVNADKQKAMSGLEFVQGLANGTLPLNTMAETLGYEIAEAEDGRVVVTAEPLGIHLNPAGTVHGGLAATMLDSCMGLAIQSTLPRGVGFTTLEFKVSFRQTDHAGNRSNQSCWDRHQPWSPGRNCGRTGHGRHGALTRPWDDHLLDF